MRADAVVLATGGLGQLWPVTTNPSIATADVVLAEPGALIGFAGPRVIETTIREKLPPGFQRAEYLKDKGMVDKVVSRGDLPTTLGLILSMLMGGAAQKKAA